MMINSIKIIEVLLGLALGTGYLTSLRFWGPIGFSELVFLAATILLFGVTNLKSNIDFTKTSLIKMTITLYLLLVAPVTTLYMTFFEQINNAPEYAASFTLGLILFLLLSRENSKIDFANITLYFALAFVLTNVVGMFIFEPVEGRYTGGANNPNQLLFYASSLSLMIVIYLRRFAWIFFPCIIYIMLLSKSDAFLLSLFMAIPIYLYLRFFYLKSASLGVNIFLVAILITCTLIAFDVLLHNLELLWESADEGNGRITLMTNGLKATAQSPLVGFGYGSFSGIDAPFEGSEAHNTFIDFAMQFGIPFSFAIYTIIFTAIFKFIKYQKHLIATFAILYLVSGLFHFYGRHFIFWVEMAVLYSYAFTKQSR